MRRRGKYIGMCSAALLLAAAVFVPSAEAATLDELDSNYQLAVAYYDKVLDQQDQNAREIAQTEASVRDKQKEVEEAERLSGEAAVELYKSIDNHSSLLSLILESESFSDALDRYDSYERIERYYFDTMEQAKAKKAELEAQVAQLEVRKGEIQAELEGAHQAMVDAEQALKDADHSDGARYFQVQGNGSNCGATSFAVGVNILLHENRYTNNVEVWSQPGFNGDSTVNLAGKAAVWLDQQGLSDQISVYAVLGDITTTKQLYDELNQGHVVIISSGGGSVWQRADGSVAAPGSFPDGHWIVFYYYKDGVFYANDSSVSREKGAGCPYTEEQMQQWLNGRGTHFATVLSKK